MADIMKEDKEIIMKFINSPMDDSSVQYPEIPQKLWEYYERLLMDNPGHKLIKAIKRQGYHKTWNGINDVFWHASQATGMTFNKLYEEIGFRENDLDENNFQALLGILRSINMLNEVGFQALRPLRPKKSQKEVDLLGRFANKLLAIEVIRSSEKKYCYPDHEKPSANSVKYVVGRYCEKRSQLASSIKEHGCAAGMLVVIMDSQPFKDLVTLEELIQVTQEAFLAMSSPAKTYLVIFTGMANEQGKNEYAIYPSLLN